MAYMRIVPSAWARTCARDPELPTRFVARDPIMSREDKVWVLRQRRRLPGTPRQENNR